MPTGTFLNLVPPERFELPTSSFVAKRSSPTELRRQTFLLNLGWLVGFEPTIT